MTPSSLRLRLLLAVAPALSGCGASSAETGPGTAPTTSATPGPTRTSTGQPSPVTTSPPAGAQAWLLGELVCTTAEHTKPRVGPSPGAPFASCQSRPDHDFITAQLGEVPCGQCTFRFAPEPTHQMRKERPDACCYHPHSAPRVGRPLVVEAHLRQAALVRRSLAWGA